MGWSSFHVLDPCFFPFFFLTYEYRYWQRLTPDGHGIITMLMIPNCISLFLATQMKLSRFFSSVGRLWGSGWRRTSFGLTLPRLSVYLIWSTSPGTGDSTIDPFWGELHCPVQIQCTSWKSSWIHSSCWKSMWQLGGMAEKHLSHLLMPQSLPVGITLVDHMKNLTV